MTRKILLTGTAETNLQEALNAERLLSRVPPSDPYWLIAASNIEFYLNCAVAIERGERYLEVAR